MGTKKHGLTLVKGGESIEPADHDIELENLGKLYFVLEYEEDGEAATIAYYKAGQIRRSANLLEPKCVTDFPFARARVSLNAFERFFGCSLRGKIRRKIEKLKNSVMVIDQLFGMGEGRRSFEIEV